MLVVIKKIINVSDNEAIIIKVIESVDAPSKINDFPLDRNEILYGILISHLHSTCREKLTSFN